MRLTAQEEYGLRCLISLARAPRSQTLTIPDIAEQESLTTAYVAKLMRPLRQAGFVESIRGRAGGYRLVRKPEELRLNEVMQALGERLEHGCTCQRFSGLGGECVHGDDCSIRSLWIGVDRLVDGFLAKWTLADLLAPESSMASLIDG